jgi:hypothetical protein
MVQAAYRGYHARRLMLSATSPDGWNQRQRTKMKISAGNLYPSLDGNKQAEPGHSGGSVLSAAAEVFLPNDADCVSKLASSARQHTNSFDTRAMKAHADPQKARLT